MTWRWIQLAAASACFLVGIIFMILAVFGVNRFHKALNRMHAAAMGDTLGILFVFAGLIVMKGFSMDSLKLFLVILFFWSAGPVSGHMISRLEAMTDEELGKILIIRKTGKERGYGEEECSADGCGVGGYCAVGYGADGCGADGCGADGCGADGCGTDGCGADGCGADGCGADACEAEGYSAKTCMTKTHNAENHNAENRNAEKHNAPAKEESTDEVI
ncbi:monovalent cation/H(+) antiporter subunit G [Enterocloster sp. OA13]|uniref:monovalent cation/H(+) antiporter subunit G n=1 Tax=Enterocloster sp. OA13 TaxID=2914161 RepID=UPI00046E5ABB|nr:monovalent cation/H(+) antiporter subunit G [Enterocloster sp. OA13]